MGDSVMWGTRVNLEDSITGKLQEILNNTRKGTEVINAGVIGYSTYQERLFFEKYLVTFRPDVVLVNFSFTDWLPTEDPFNRARGVYTRYLTDLLKTKRDRLQSYEKRAVRLLIKDLEKQQEIWHAFSKRTKQPQLIRIFFRILIEIPIKEMSQIASDNHIRLIYLFIPHSFPSQGQRLLDLRLQAFMKRNAIEAMDLFNDMVKEEDVNRKYASHQKRFWKDMIRFLRMTQLDWPFQNETFRDFDPITSLENIGRYRAYRHRHRHMNYIDGMGHPSKKGTRIIAERIYHYLMKEKHHGGNAQL